MNAPRANLNIACLIAVALLTANPAVSAQTPNSASASQGAAQNTNAKPDAVSLDAVFERGAINGSSYSNPLLGFSFAVPKDWRVLSKAEIVAAKPKAAELSAQQHPERSEQIREQAQFTALLFMAAQKIAGPDKRSFSVMAVPIDESDAGISGDEMLRRLAAKGRRENRPDRYVSEPEAKTYGGRKLWRADLQRAPSGPNALVRELIFVERGLCVVVMGGASNHADLDQLESVFESLRFFQPTN